MKFYKTSCEYKKIKSDAYQAVYLSSCDQELVVEIPMDVTFGYDTTPEIKFCPSCGLDVEVSK